MVFSSLYCCHSSYKSFFLYQQNKSSGSKVKFRQANNHCKRVLEAAKLLKQKSPSLPWDLVLGTFGELLMLLDKSAIPPLSGHILAVYCVQLSHGITYLFAFFFSFKFYKFLPKFSNILPFFDISLTFFWKITPMLLLSRISLVYSMAQSCCLLHLIKQNCLLKTFLRTLILMTRVSLYLFSFLELIWNYIIFL